MLKGLTNVSMYSRDLCTWGTRRAVVGQCLVYTTRLIVDACFARRIQNQSQNQPQKKKQLTFRCKIKLIDFVVLRTRLI